MSEGVPLSLPPTAWCHTASQRFPEPRSTQALLPHRDADLVFWTSFFVLTNGNLLGASEAPNKTQGACVHAGPL